MLIDTAFALQVDTKEIFTQNAAPCSGKLRVNRSRPFMSFAKQIYPAQDSASSFIFALFRLRLACLRRVLSISIIDFPAGRSHYGRRLFIALLFSLLTSLSMQALATEQQPPREVLDLHYGEVLYYFYQGDYFSSITRLQAAQQRNHFTHHQKDAELLFGGLMLSYGLHDEAEEIFKRLLDRQTNTAVHDRAWFYLAKLRYQLGDMAKAQDALARISPADHNPEHQLLLADVLMAQGNYEQVINILGNSKGASDMFAYGKYNLGVALIKNGHVDAGISLLNELGSIELGDTQMNEETLALQDKTNLTLGYYYIQQNEPETAKTFLERVQLNGLFSGKALLGMGWAESASGRYQQALVPWDELSTRNVIDTSVQEALLAMPYALEKLQAHGQAADHYHTAIEIFEREIGRINTIKTSIEHAGIADSLLQYDPGTGMGWLWQLRRLPEGTQNQYLFRLLAEHEFQEVLKNYRDLRFLEEILNHWTSSMDAFDDILALRKNAYASRLPRIQASYQQLDLDKARQTRDAYFSSLAAIEQNNDALALATAKEQRLWTRLQHVKEILARHSGRENMDNYREKQRLLEGLFIWQINQEYKPRLWQVRKHLNELDRMIMEAQQRQQSLLNAQLEAPKGFEGYENRIEGFKDRLDLLQSRVAQTRTAQERYLQKLVSGELENRQAHLRTYLNQARYGLAQIYDTTMQPTGGAQ